jgi:alkylated DNA repair dioxygenase AlkB
MTALPARQIGLFGGSTPAVDATALARAPRLWLDRTAWVEYVPSWLSGDETLLDDLIPNTRWHEQQREIYDRTVTVPRLVASLPADGKIPAVLEHARAQLNARYETKFVNIGLGYYRHGADSVAWHGDYVARELRQAVVATISLGEPRRFLLRPKGGGASIAYSLGWGDLLVMGGSCQRTWQHAVPKVAHAGPRIAVMFRPVWYQP